MVYKKLGARRRYPTRNRRRNKRWSVSVGGHYQNALFGKVGGNVRFNSRAFNSAVKRIVNTSGAPLHMTTNPSLLTAKHDTIYTLPVFQNVIKSTTDVGGGYREADRIKPLSLHLKGAIDFPVGDANSICKFAIVSIDGDYLSAAGLNWGSGVGSSDLFRTGSTGEGLINSLGDPKKCKFMFSKIIKNNNVDATSKQTKFFDMYFKFSPSFQYKYLTSSNYGEKNIYLVFFSDIKDGVAGTTTTAYVHTTLDFCYIDNA